jgi:NAD(P)-dependent dehydrogenase (short-subunit alcohol dehydrogenase family)
MTEDLRFEGRVAVVTGSGRGLGLAHARELARRGTKVVVNDMGSHGTGVGSSPERAHEAVNDIVAEGGTAVAHFGDVSDPSDAAGLINMAVKTYGRIDIVVNNAGIAKFVPFEDITVDQFLKFVRVHLLGSMLVTQAAWPHMVEQGYGRVVMTSSSGMFGTPNNVCYDAAKAGVFGLMKSLSVAGRPHGILVNGLLPTADTPLRVDMLEGADVGAAVDEMPDYMKTLMTFNQSPDLVAPVACWLAHETFTSTGELFHAGAGWVGQVLISQGGGYADEKLTAEKVRDNWAAISQPEPLTPITDTESAVRGLVHAAEGALKR